MSSNKQPLFFYILLFIPFMFSDCKGHEGHDRKYYEYAFTVGKKGKKPGEFNQPIGITIDQKGFLYVSDAGNQRIQKFTPQGSFLLSWGSHGKGKGKLDRPMHLSFGPDGYLYVAEYLNDRIQVFDTQGKFIRFIGNASILNAPHSVAVSAQGSIYVVDTLHHNIKKFDSHGKFITSIGKRGRIWGGTFNYPSDIIIGSSGNLYVADSYNHRIQKLTQQGKRIKTIGGLFGIGIPLSWKGFFNVATSIHIDSHENIYVVDFYNHRIQKFNKSGKFLTQFGSKILRYPTDITLDHKGDVWVVDYGQNRLVKFTKKK